MFNLITHTMLNLKTENRAPKMDTFNLLWNPTKCCFLAENSVSGGRVFVQYSTVFKELCSPKKEVRCS